MDASPSSGRWAWLAWLLAFASGGLALLGFAALAALSVPLESLGLMHAAMLLWLCCMCGWILAVLATAIITFFSIKGRLCLWALLASIGTGLMLSLPLLRHLGFDEEDAIHFAIRQYEPLVRALREFEHERGGPPEALEQLVPRYITAIPKPRFCDTDCSLEYRLVEGGWMLDLMVPLSELCIGDEGFLEYCSSQEYQKAFDIAGTPLSQYDQSYRGWRYRIE